MNPERRFRSSARIVGLHARPEHAMDADGVGDEQSDQDRPQHVLDVGDGPAWCFARAFHPICAYLPSKPITISSSTPGTYASTFVVGKVSSKRSSSMSTVVDSSRHHGIFDSKLVAAEHGYRTGHDGGPPVDADATHRVGPRPCRGWFGLGVDLGVGLTHDVLLGTGSRRQNVPAMAKLVHRQCWAWAAPSTRHRIAVIGTRGCRRRAMTGYRPAAGRSCLAAIEPARSRGVVAPQMP